MGELWNEEKSNQWFAEKRDYDGFKCWTVKTPYNRLVADLLNEEDAIAISALPELLEAAEDALSYIQNTPAADDAVARNLKEAIAKAKGES